VKKIATRSKTKRAATTAASRAKGRSAPARAGKRPRPSEPKRYLRLVASPEGARVEESADPSFKKAKKVVAKVNRDAYTFRPDALLTVGVDVANGRVVVRDVVSAVPLPARDHFNIFQRAVGSAAHLYCLKERTRLGIYLRDCPHPTWAIKRKQYVVDQTRHTTITKHAHFCTRCGLKVRD
jgi:hypothetical protein